MQKQLFVCCYIIPMTVPLGDYLIMVKILRIYFNYGDNFLVLLDAHVKNQVFLKFDISIEMVNIPNLLCKKLTVSKFLTGNTQYFDQNPRFLIIILGFSFEILDI